MRSSGRYDQIAVQIADGYEQIAQLRTAAPVHGETFASQGGPLVHLC